MSILTGLRANKNAKRVARGIEERGEADARLRRIRAERLLGQIRDSASKRGFRLRSQTAQDLEREAATLEGMDIDRITFRAAVESHQARLEGQAAIAQGVSQTFSQAVGAIQLGFAANRFFNTEAALGKTPSFVFDPVKHRPFRFDGPGVVPIDDSINFGNSAGLA